MSHVTGDVTMTYVKRNTTAQVKGARTADLYVDWDPQFALDWKIQDQNTELENLWPENTAAVDCTLAVCMEYIIADKEWLEYRDENYAVGAFCPHFVQLY